jgi:hypothetical protein
MPKGKIPPRPAFEPPNILGIEFQELPKIAEIIENLIVKEVARDLWTYEPGIYHNTESVACPVWKGWDRLNRYSPNRFTDANPIFIGGATHKAIAPLIPNSFPEYEVTERFTDPDLDITFHVDIYCPDHELIPEEVEPKTLAEVERPIQNIIYEIKTKDHYINYFDPKIPVSNRPEAHNNVSPTTVYLNQIIPYLVEGDSNIAYLVYVPKSMYLDLLVYQIVFDTSERRDSILATLHKRAGVLKRIDEQFHNKDPLSLLAIEPSGACRTYCNFNRDKSVHYTQDGQTQICPVKELPRRTHLVGNEDLKQIYDALWEYLSQQAPEFDFNRGFYQIQQVKPELMQISYNAALGVLRERLPDLSDENLESALGALLDLLPNKKKPDIRYIKLLENDILQIFPLREQVERGWAPFVFGDLPLIRESTSLAQVWNKLMINRLYPTDVSASKEDFFVFQPYDYKGFFGCPRLQAFTNEREIGLGFTNNPGFAKLWFIDMAIYQTLRYLLSEGPGRLYTVDFADTGYSFRFLMSSKAVFGQNSPLLILPIHHTEWRELYGSRTLSDPPVITPMEKHTKQAALLSAILQEQGAPDLPMVLQMYYPRKDKGDIRLYGIRPKDPSGIIQEALDFIKEIRSPVTYKGDEYMGIARTGEWCTWCIMLQRCLEGLDYVEESKVKQLFPAGLTEDGDFIYRTF